ncbi:MAG: TonB family protein [Vicinamibacterales bacterium]
MPESRVRALVEAGHAAAVRGFVPCADAVSLVRLLRTETEGAPTEQRAAFTAAPSRARRTSTSLILSGLLHGALLALLLTLASLGVFNSADTEQVVPAPAVHLVFLTSLGPGGGGGGGGLKMPAPPPPAERKAPKPEKKPASPVPPVKKTPAPPRTIERPPLPVATPTPQPPPILRPEPPRFMPQAIQAPVVPVPAGPVDAPGALTPAPSSAKSSNGPGAGGGVGSGQGVGIGEGRGGGIGPGSGGGTGGGPFQPGSGVEPPVLLREVRPGYTEEARRQAIEGDVVLEIVVRQDGSVGNVKVTRSLGAGLEQKAVEAVRQWRFGPARRQGAPVDVVVEVSVEFKLR